MTWFPFMTLFYFTLILGSLVSLSGTHWIFIWVGMELNLLSFIPLLTASSNNQEAEAAMKYFLAQVLGSGLILLSIFTLFSPMQPLMSVNFIFIIGILIKCGLPPCHFWYPSVMSLISWPMCMILSTWQKITPLMIFMVYITPSLTLVLMVLVILSSLFGGIGGLTQVQLRPLLAYSSIGHMAWMLAASMKSFLVSFLYFISYSIMSLTLMFILWLQSLTSSLYLNKCNENLKYFIGMSATLISLGGVPPMFGFFPKWMVISLLNSLSMFIIFILVVGSMINLYYYMNIVFMKFLTTTNFMNLSIGSPYNYLYVFILMSTSTLPIIPFTMLMFYALTFLYKS